MKKPYVAIVDDDAGFAQYLRTFLSLRGYEARCYTRGDELLASMKQTEAPDVVLLDVMMPGLDGMATLRALKASRPEAQVIMLSGRNQASTIVEAVRLDVQEAPQREIKKQKDEAEAARILRERARSLNKPNFRP